MPIPFILAGVALAAAGYGVKKGIDAKEDFDRADEINSDAKEVFQNAQQRLEKIHGQTKNAMEQLGHTKFETYEQICTFVGLFERIKNIDFEDAQIKSELGNLRVSQAELKGLQQTALDMQTTVNAGIASLGAGGLAGLAAYGGVGMFAAASTGTAIGGLSGVAATNATLAWLGGGSLAAGGFGMAGGMAVLGGIVAGPVLAIGGAMLASKAEEAVHNAHSNFAKAELEAEKLKNAAVLTRAIGEKFLEVYGVLSDLGSIFARFIESLDAMTKQNTDFRSYTKPQKELVGVSFATAATLKNLLEAQILEQDGSLRDVSAPLETAKAAATRAY